MTKRKEQLKIIRDQRSEELSNAALNIFARKGFAATKISDITSSANLSYGLFYHYFQSKEHLYVTLVSSILDLFIETMTEIENRADTPKDKLAWLTELTFSGSLEHALNRHLLVIEAHQSDFLSDDVKQEFITKYTTSMNVLCRIIEQGQKDGLFIEGDPMELAIYYQSLTQGLTLWNARGIYPIEVEISVEKVLRFFLV